MLGKHNLFLDTSIWGVVTGQLSRSPELKGQSIGLTLSCFHFHFSSLVGSFSQDLHRGLRQSFRWSQDQRWLHCASFLCCCGLVHLEMFFPLEFGRCAWSRLLVLESLASCRDWQCELSLGAVSNSSHPRKLSHKDCIFYFRPNLWFRCQRRKRRRAIHIWNELTT